MNIELFKDIMYHVVGIIYDVRNELGPGLNESVYQEGLEIEFKLQKIPYEREKVFHPIYRGVEMETTFRLDFTCMNNVIIECKGVSELCNDHRSQLFNYMRLTKMKMGILVNFASTFIEIERYFYDPEQNEILTYNGNKLNTTISLTETDK